MGYCRIHAFYEDTDECPHCLKEYKPVATATLEKQVELAQQIIELLRNRYCMCLENNVVIYHKECKLLVKWDKSLGKL